MTQQQLDSHWFFDDDDLLTIHTALDSRRVPGTYEPGKWSVSHYNRDPAALPTPFPPSVSIRDITLRTIEQAHGAPLQASERLRLAEALVEAGVTALQVSFGAWSSIDEQVAALSSLSFDGELAVDGIIDEDQINGVAEAGVNLVQFMNPSMPGVGRIYQWHAFKMAWEGKDWRALPFPQTVEEQVERIAALTARAHACGVRASAGINMVGYSTPEYLASYCEGVLAAGIDQITLCDGAGGMGPEAWSYVVRQVRAAAPTLPIAVHAHNPFGLGAACSLAAVHAGADIVEVSVNHVCTGTGQADLAEVVAALEILYGVHTGIRLETLTDLRRLVEDLSRIRMADTKPVTGEHAWSYHSEIAANQMRVEPLLHYCVMPEVFGNREISYIGKGSSNWAMLAKLESLGVEVDRSAVPAILDRVKAEMHIRKRILSDDEIETIALRLARQPSPAN